ncbi:MAG: polyphosphate polymerase domain-containing protein [Planctomycetia bacterium]|nr:polyphosphate polymerase domain-containing protein [Planctomycetia bacterium]
MTEGILTAPATDAVRSPGLGASDLGRAFELKFRLSAAEAQDVEAWARGQLTPDPHGQDGRYRVTSVYCDTPYLDVFHRSRGYRRNKFRLRRYGSSEQVFLERKTRRGDRVTKRRIEVPAHQLNVLNEADPSLDWVGFWFLQRVRQRDLQPNCQVAYWRTAFFGMVDGMPVRLTLDRELIGTPLSGWNVPHLDDGQALLPGGALLEMKFHIHMPKLFQDLLPRLPIQEARVSKYRRCVELCGLQAATPTLALPTAASANVALREARAQ